MARSEMLKRHQRILELKLCFSRVSDKFAKAVSFIVATDSEVNIQRLHNTQVLDAICDSWERRVIKDACNASVNLQLNFCFCDGKLNPADGPSRAIWKRTDLELAV